MRALYTDGWNSASHVAQGAIFGAKLFPLFLAYQMAQGKPNDFVDVLEYLSGWIMNELFVRTTGSLNAIPPVSTTGGGSGFAHVLYSGSEGWTSDQGG